ncbi:MAG: DUF1016 family protein [Spirochaetales bacterium]|nr:DUF1016 family protein [Spirochaetales bacterium]
MDNTIMTLDKSYRDWIEELSKRYRSSQIKASCFVNRAMLEFYWSLGRDIVLHEDKNVWGSSFYETLSNDLIRMIPNAKGFSATNLKYMRRFYDLFPLNNRPQPVDGNLSLYGSENRPQLGDDYDVIFMIPWGHIRKLLDKCNGDGAKALFYARQTLEHNWSRAVLQNWLDTDLYERQGKAITNFTDVLPAPQSDLAQEITRDPYNFDFLSIRQRYDEKELKDALIDNIQKFLLELGTGFSFIGREFRLVVGKTEQFIDLLFYNYQIHCFVVVEVKVTDFDPRDMGQLITYVSAVDGIMKTDGDQPTVGLLICKTKDNVLAKYATNAVKVPVGISEYQITNFLQKEFKGSLPTIEELENEFGQK